MYRKCIGSDPTAARLDFALYEVAGEWESRSGSPRVRIYRNPGRRGGGFYVEVSYKDGTRFSRPVRKYWGGIRYFDLYGGCRPGLRCGARGAPALRLRGLLPGVGMTAQVFTN